MKRQTKAPLLSSALNQSTTNQQGKTMPRKYSPSASKDVENEMHKFNEGALKSGKGGKGGPVKSRKQAIAIGLSEARKEGKKVPLKPSANK
jgi:hypothetical protein